MTGFATNHPEVVEPTLHEYLGCFPVVVLHVDAAWNGSGHLLHLALRKLETQYPATVVFAAMDLENPENKELLREFLPIHNSLLIYFYYAETAIVDRKPSEAGVRNNLNALLKDGLPSPLLLDPVCALLRRAS